MEREEQASSVQFEGLPFEITQAILRQVPLAASAIPELNVYLFAYSHLPLKDLIPVSLLSSTLRAVSLSPQITPFLGPVQRILLRGPPYPPELASLGSYTHVARNVFTEILVRGEARWILEEMEIPKLSDAVWEEVFRRRFLPSWRRYREGDERWRAMFLRMLRRLEHRALGCTHEESWTVS